MKLRLEKKNKNFCPVAVYKQRSKRPAIITAYMPVPSELCINVWLVI